MAVFGIVSIGKADDTAKQQRWRFNVAPTVLAA
jgi:hypothetical protein